MSAVKLAVRRNHLRFDPQTELQPKRVDLVAQMAQSLREFMRVVKPIAQRGIVAFAMPKPAVIQNKQFDARIFCTAGEGEQLFLGEIEVGCFPVVDQNFFIY